MGNPNHSKGGVTMSKLTVGMFLPKGTMVEPEPIFIEDYKSIQDAIGGHFDVVVTDLGKDNVSIVGYVHDEGLLLDLELNYLATNLFQKELRGDCVIVWGLSPNGEYDGDNYDIPEWITDFIMKDLVVSTAGNYNMASVLSDVCKYAISNKLATLEDVVNISKALHDNAVNGKVDYEAEKNLMAILNKVADFTDEEDIKDFCKLVVRMFQENHEQGE
jgi:hypothetical protein